MPDDPIVVTASSLRSALGSRSLEAMTTANDESEAPSPEVLALLMHGLHEVEAEGDDDGVLVAPGDQLASLMQTYVAREAKKHPESRTGPAGGGGLEARFDERDPGWVKSLPGWLDALIKRWNLITKFDWVDDPGPPAEIPDKARVALFGDWGTGLYGAPKISSSIRNASPKPDAVIHLGDIYYSGDDDEVAERCLAYWPWVDGAVSRACNGNHEMYTGGQAYLKLVNEQFQQPASFFLVRNEHWNIVGLDTAYIEHDLAGEQAQWLMDVLAESDGRRTILLSHHQLFSAFGKPSVPVIRKLASLLSKQEIFAWYWGHEHRCVLYDQHESWGLWGRCIGHGGIPYFRDKWLKEISPAPTRTRLQRMDARGVVPGCRVLDGPNPYVQGPAGKYGPQGYVMLDFDGPNVTERICLPDGEQIDETAL